jgi:hypothetical protein
VEKTNGRNEKENKQTNRTEQNRTGQDRTERRKTKRKTTQQTLERKKLRSPLRNQKSDFLFCVFWQNHNCHEQMESFTRCSRLALQRNFSLEADLQIYRSCQSHWARQRRKPIITAQGEEGRRLLYIYQIAKKLPQLPTNERVLNVF